MQDKVLYEYAVVRLVPCVEREEFINIGVILYCSKQKFLKCLTRLDSQKLQAISKGLDLEELQAHVNSFQAICEGSTAGGVIGALDAPSRFRWLTATRSTIIQTSKVHPGLCSNPNDTIALLFSQFVL